MTEVAKLLSRKRNASFRRGRGGSPRGRMGPYPALLKKLTMWYSMIAYIRVTVFLVIPESRGACLGPGPPTSEMGGKSKEEKKPPETARVGHAKEKVKRTPVLFQHWRVLATNRKRGAALHASHQTLDLPWTQRTKVNLGAFLGVNNHIRQREKRSWPVRFGTGLKVGCRRTSPPKWLWRCHSLFPNTEERTPGVKTRRTKTPVNGGIPLVGAAQLVGVQARNQNVLLTRREDNQESTA